jgi:hypothetical protein
MCQLNELYQISYIIFRINVEYTESQVEHTAEILWLAHKKFISCSRNRDSLSPTAVTVEW